MARKAARSWVATDPKPVSCSRFHSLRKANHRTSPLSRKIQTLPRAARRRFARYTLHAACHAVPHTAHITCRMSCRAPSAEKRKPRDQKYANHYGKTSQAAQISILPLDKTDMAPLRMLLIARLAARALGALVFKLKFSAC